MPKSGQLKEFSLKKNQLFSCMKRALNSSIDIALSRWFKQLVCVSFLIVKQEKNNNWQSLNYNEVQKCEFLGH